MNKFITVFLTVFIFTVSTLAKDEVSEILFKGGPLPLDRIVQNPRIGSGERFSGPLISRWYMDNPKAQVTGASPIVKENELYGWNIYWVKKSSPTFVSVEYLQATSPFVLPEGMSVESVMKEMWQSVSKKFSFYKCWPVVANVVKKDQITTIHGLWYMKDTRSDLKFGKSGSATFSIPNSDLNGHQKHGEMAMTIKIPVPLAVREFAITHTVQSPNLGEVVVMPPFKHSWTKWFSIEPRVSKGKIIEVRIKSVLEGTPPHTAGLEEESTLRSIQGINPVGLTEAEFGAKLNAASITDELVLEVIEKSSKEPRIFRIPIHNTVGTIVSSTP